MSQERQWVELDPTNGNGATTQEAPPKDTDGTPQPDAGQRDAPQTESEAPPGDDAAADA